MGYYITLMNSHFVIRQSNLPKFFDLVGRMVTDENIEKNASGYSLLANGTKTHHYSWISTDRLRNAIASNNMTNVFEQFRYSIEFSHSVGEMNFYRIRFADNNGGDQKIGDEEKLFAAIAEIVEDGSFIDIQGEDNLRWRWIWENGKFFQQDEEDIVIQYGTPQEIVFDGITNREQNT